MKKRRNMRHGYAGKQYDTVTGMYDYGFRDYSPAYARFTTPDPIRDGRNWFSYVNNDPVNFVDLWGLMASEQKQGSVASPAINITTTLPNRMVEGPKTKEQVRDEYWNDRLSEQLSSFVGISYVLGGQSHQGLDCSGTLVQSLWDLGFNVPDTNVANVFSGNLDWVNISTEVDVNKAGNQGIINGYKWAEQQSVSHVNVGIGTTNTPLVVASPVNQIIDATEGGTLNVRNDWFDRGQYTTNYSGQINQTFAPYSSKTDPAAQATLNWDTLLNDYKVWHGINR